MSQSMPLFWLNNQKYVQKIDIVCSYKVIDIDFWRKSNTRATKSCLIW